MLDRQTEKTKRPRDEKPAVTAEQAPDREKERTLEAPAQAEPPPDKAPASDAPPRRGRKRFAIVVLLALGMVGAGYYYWLSNRDYESTDDAYTDGRAVTVAPEVSGRVVSLDVTDNQFVHAGQPLIHIDDRQYVIDRNQAEGALAAARGQLAALQYAADVARKNFPASLMQSQAQLESAKAALAKAEADAKRQQSLPKQATTQQEVDAAMAAWRQAKAQVQQAEAQVQQAEPVQQRIDQTVAQVDDQKGQVEQAQARLDQALLNLSRCVIVAPQDGWITKRNVEKGNYVTPGQQILSIVSPQIWVTANFKETQLSLMRPGQPVTIEVDAYPELHLEGHVDSIQLGSGSKFTAFPPENATGNFVKIVQRVPVKIAIDKGLDPKIPLPLGISVDPRVKIR